MGRSFTESVLFVCAESAQHGGTLFTRLFAMLLETVPDIMYNTEKQSFVRLLRPFKTERKWLWIKNIYGCWRKSFLQ